MRVRYDTTNIDFYWDEVGSVTVNTVQNVDRFWKQSNYVHQYRIGKAYKTIEVVLKNDKKTGVGGGDPVRTRANTLFEQVDSYYQPKLMQCYYKYHIDNTVYANVQMQRDQYSKEYLFSYESANPIRMVFVESSAT